jgi:hypothetical protein
MLFACPAMLLFLKNDSHYKLNISSLHKNKLVHYIGKKFKKSVKFSGLGKTIDI